MSKWTVVNLKQELVEQVEKEVDASRYRSLSDFVSEAIQLRLQTLVEKRKASELTQPKIVGMREYTCTNSLAHRVKVVKYEDSSIWVACPMFGWFEDVSMEGASQLGCKERKKRCTWFVG
jgi:Arc/MetJ-type ribon-helix-helix transcriptional regulator